MTDLDEALAEERNREELPRAMRERMAARLHAAIIAVPPPASTPPPAPAAGLAKLIGVGVICALIGGAIGVIVAPRTQVASAPVPVRPRVTTPAPPAPIAPVLAPAPAPIVAVPEEVQQQPAPAPRPRMSLEEERTLIDEARSALAHRNTAAAMEVLDRHAARFPHGALAEEREGLRVIALSRTDGAAAAAQAARFERRYPSSVLRPAIERALRNAPREDDHEQASGQ